MLHQETPDACGECPISYECSGIFQQGMPPCVTERKKVRIKQGWSANWLGGRTGMTLGPDVMVEQWWTPVKWDDEDDPDWFKTAGLEIVP